MAAGAFGRARNYGRDVPLMTSIQDFLDYIFLNIGITFYLIL